MLEIRPIKDLRNTAEISRLCEESKEPIYITKKLLWAFSRHEYGNL